MGEPVLLFAPETLNLAEVTRTLQVAKVARRSFECVFCSYDARGRNHAFIEREGFRVVPLEPQLSDERVERFWQKNRGEAIAQDYFSDAELEARVQAECALIRRLSARAVITGFCLSTALSARLARVPLVWINQTTWLLEYFQRFGTWPDAIDSPLSRLVPARLRDRMAARAAPFTFWTMNRGFNRVARRLGLSGFSGSELLEGDENWFAEPPDFSGLEVPERLAGRHDFIGPLFGGLPLEVPEAVRALPRDQPIVYFAMGSSGVEALIARLIPAFGGRPYRVIAPVAPLLRRLAIDVPDNVIVTDWIPAEQVNPMAAVSVVHGGIGTLLTACAAGTPIVAIPNGNPEQECNVECLVRKGIATRLRIRRLDVQQILSAIDRALVDEVARSRAREFQRSVLAWDAPENAARLLERRFA